MKPVQYHFTIFLVIIINAFGISVRAQEEAVTASGKVVLLYPDSTWRLKVVQVTDTAAVDTTIVVATPKEKEFKETFSGFKGFLKSELELPPLPPRSQGTYEFRVKVNKEGYVKEVVTLLRGPNGDAEKTIRSAISKQKYLPDGSIVPPLTEGVIRVVVQ